MLSVFSVSHFFSGQYNSSKQRQVCKSKNDSVILLLLMNVAVPENMKAIQLRSCWEKSVSLCPTSAGNHSDEPKHHSWANMHFNIRSRFSKMPE